jgi:cytochrome c556
MAPRARDTGDWMALSLKLIEAALDALDAAIKKDADRLLLVGGAVYDTCAACHVKYLSPEQRPEL